MISAILYSILKQKNSKRTSSFHEYDKPDIFPLLSKAQATVRKRGIFDSFFHQTRVTKTGLNLNKEEYNSKKKNSLLQRWQS